VATKKTAKKKTSKKKAASKKAAKKKATKKKSTKKAAKKATKKKAAKKATKKAAPKKKATKKAAPKKKATKKAAPKKKATKKAAPKKKATPKKAPLVQANEGVDPAKLSAVLEVLLPDSSSSRAAASAAASVWAISSEKTQDVRAAIRVRDSLAEDVVREELAEFAEEEAPAEIAHRRSKRDPFGFFREELGREELHSEDLVAGWRHKNQRLRHELVRGIPNDELREVERQLGFDLPPSYRDFVLEWGSGELFTRPEGGYRLIAPGEILPEARLRLGGLMRQPYLPIVDLGCADYLCLNTSQPKKNGEFPVWWWHCGVPQRRVADTFLRWLKQIVEAKGEPYWWAVGAQ
jgi:SMI1/KNR4 family protein SUKH-1